MESIMDIGTTSSLQMKLGLKETKRLLGCGITENGASLVFPLGGLFVFACVLVLVQGKPCFKSHFYLDVCLFKAARCQIM